MSQKNNILAANGLFVICAVGLLLVCHSHYRSLNELKGQSINSSHQIMSQKGYQLLKQEAGQELWFNKQTATCTRIELGKDKILSLSQVEADQCQFQTKNHHTVYLEKSNMAEYCAGVAAEKYTQQPSNIIIEPTEYYGNQFIVYGEYDDPESNSDITTFHCAFSKEGKLRFIEKAS